MATTSRCRLPLVQWRAHDGRIWGNCLDEREDEVGVLIVNRYVGDPVEEPPDVERVSAALGDLLDDVSRGESDLVRRQSDRPDVIRIMELHRSVGIMEYGNSGRHRKCRIRPIRSQSAFKSARTRESVLTTSSRIG
jgi:hypothetical protein